MHLRGRLGARCHLELDLDAVDGVRLARRANVERRHDQRDLADRRVLPQPAADLSLRAARQHGAVHVGGAAGHGRPGVDVLLHRMLGEPLGGEHHDLARVDVGLVGHAEHAAEVVGMAVGVDDGDDGTVAAVGAVHPQCGRRGLGGDQRVDDDDAGVALDEADVGQIQTAHLVDALDHLVETLLGRERGLPPQAGVHRRRRVPGEEVVDVVVPHHPTVGGLDDARLQRGDETPVGVLEVARVVEGKTRQMVGVGGLDDGGGWLLIHSAKPATQPASDGAKLSP